MTWPPWVRNLRPGSRGLRVMLAPIGVAGLGFAWVQRRSERTSGVRSSLSHKSLLCQVIRYTLRWKTELVVHRPPRRWVAERGDLPPADHCPPVSAGPGGLVDQRVASDLDLHPSQPSQPAQPALLELEDSGGLTVKVDRRAVASSRPRQTRNLHPQEGVQTMGFTARRLLFSISASSAQASEQSQEGDADQ